MRNVLLQLDTSPLPSVFDRVVAYDAGADEVLSYGGIRESDIRELVHGCIFARGPKDLKHTAVFMAARHGGGDAFSPRPKALVRPSCSLMLDSMAQYNGRWARARCWRGG